MALQKIAPKETKEKAPPAITEYKGHPMLVLNPSDFKSFQFGTGKAKLILDNLDSIIEFVKMGEPGYKMPTIVATKVKKFLGK